MADNVGQSPGPWHEAGPFRPANTVYARKKGSSTGCAENFVSVIKGNAARVPSARKTNLAES